MLLLQLQMDLENVPVIVQPGQAVGTIGLAFMVEAALKKK
jgi:hypothetical protein